MRQIIKEGGDTDTNACIAGGMLGALIGFKNIPSHMKENVLSFDCTKKYEKNELGITRPEFLSTKKYAMQNIKKVIEIRPKQDI
jgi:ADP-ribosyl-[dinitrogen reductase] hydrolase